MAIRITRVYTRGGDKGRTSLVGGVRVDKDCAKLDAYGTLDELLCHVGAARSALAALVPSAAVSAIPLGSIGSAAAPANPADAKTAAASRSLPGRRRKQAASSAPGTPVIPVSPAELESWLRRVQNRLFDAGSILATPAGHSYPGMPSLSGNDVDLLEREMDSLQAVLPALDSFVLPGGSPANAAFHLCRAVCRRAEREAVRLSREEAVPATVLAYLNRLSDWFFVMARYAAWLENVPEFLWEYPGRRSAAGTVDAGTAKGGSGVRARRP